MMGIMKKYGFLKKMMAISIVVSLVFSMVPQNFSMAASSVVLEENYLKHSTFEETDVSLSTDFPTDKFGNWYAFQGPIKVQGNAHEGDWSVKMSTAGQSLEQDVKGLQPGLTYEYAVWVKADDVTKGALKVGVKNHGSSEARVTATSNDWKRYSLEFTSTTGRVRTYAWLDTNTAGNNFYMDDATLTLKSDLKQVDVVNGMVTAQFKDDYSGIPDPNSFEVTYSSSLEPNTILPVTITDSSIATGNKILSLHFTPLAAQPQAQLITMYVKYKKNNTNQTVTLDFPIEASGEQVITAEVQTLAATNGTITAVLNQAPTIAPVASDFTVTYSVNGGTFNNLITKDFEYDKNSHNVTFNYNQLSSSPSEQTVIVKVIYQGKETTSQFIIGVEEGVTYYVSNTGSDSNNGLSPETAFQTIEKLNTMTFKPGDHILFKKGDVFKGAWKPIGSGSQGFPIIASSYGPEGAPRPVLNPSDTNWSATLMSAEFSSTVTVNNVISFYNQQYWEVRDLELSGPNHAPDQSVYRRGINITGEDAGDLNHFYFDNLVIHGFHGPNSNSGKSSGGILMEVQATANTPASAHIPTSINDIRITNSELYDLGRSGINFVSVWARRADTTDTKWGPYPSNHAPGRAGYTWKPYEDFYLANNLIYDIDGDGAIIDNTKDAVVENNLVYRTMKGAPYAVGLFNWNSDNTIFQFNEVYDTQRGGDGQGIEIDALNDTTYVQYNYLHDNAGGTFMWCNTPGLYGFNGVYRYNISQNDDTEHGVIDWRGGTFGAQAYNNTIYMKKDGYKKFVYGNGGSSDAKFYNNIFYYPGDTPFQVTSFSENNIDWKNNIFYNFSNTPSNDNAVITLDPMFVDPGKGGTGVGKPVDVASLNGYKLKQGSPAINAGRPIANNGGRDYFGNPLTGIPDIGAYDSGLTSMNVGSTVYNVNQALRTISIADTETLNVTALLSNLTYDAGVHLKVYSGAVEITGMEMFKAGDTLKVISGVDEVIYTLSIVRNPSSDAKDIPLAKLSANAGSWESSGGASEGPASLVLDNKVNTIWHSKWAGDSRDNLHITIALSDDAYMVDGLRYQPRIGGGGNGIIKQYKIQYSTNGTDFVDVPGATGTWNTTGWQNVQFAPVAAKSIRLYAIDSISAENNKLFASAAEIRLTGFEKEMVDTTPPTAPSNLTVSNVGDTTAMITWVASTGNVAITGYEVFVNDVLFDTVNTTNLTLTGLMSNVDNQVKIRAMNANGFKSDFSSVVVTTTVAPSEPMGVLSGSQVVQLDEEFNVVYGLNNITDTVYGQDITFTYDSDKLELVNVNASHDHFRIVQSIDNIPGQLRLLSAGLGSGIMNEETLIITFKAKAVINTPGTVIHAVNGIVANGVGQEVSLKDAALNIVITDIPVVTIPGDVNLDGKVSIGDLALIAVAYGKNSTDPDWNKYRILDVNKDNQINIEDLAFVASKILGN
ncbi:discoidin domain-containing protein [Paenibacillus sp. CMAA1364]